MILCFSSMKRKSVTLLMMLPYIDVHQTTTKQIKNYQVTCMLFQIGLESIQNATVQ